MNFKVALKKIRKKWLLETKFSKETPKNFQQFQCFELFFLFILHIYITLKQEFANLHIKNFPGIPLKTLF